MSYVEGFVVPVPKANKEAYRAFALKVVPLFKEIGVTRFVECWEEDVPDGKVTDFRRAVQAKEDEAVVFAWLEYPSKEVRDAANAIMRSDPRFHPAAEMPFDGKRMIFGGFAPIIDV